MQFSLESLAALATILGTALSVLALIKSRDWLVAISLPLIGVAIVTGWCARRERLALKSAAVTIEGYNIDSLTAANLKRRVNRTLAIQEAQHVARIDGGDLKIEWTYSGYCRGKRESVMEFSVESARVTTFAELDCVAYDIEHDPAMKHKIRPLLIGAEGLSKKISVPFLEPLRHRQPFRVMLKCTLPGCITPGFAYYTATLSFAQDRIRRRTVRLIFVGHAPAWVRAYDDASPPQLLKTLSVVRHQAGEFEYVDVIEDAAGRSARVYAFWRDCT